MKMKILTLFPMMFEPLSHSILGRAMDKELLSIEVMDIRAFSQDKHRRVDDTPYGGGAGLLMQAQPIVSAVRYAASWGFTGRRIYLSPKGKRFDQAMARSFAGEDELLLLCGHYEGVDERALELCMDEEISIGDYVLTGGEVGAMVLIDAIARLIPGVLGSSLSSQDESFSDGTLEYPQYTRPQVFESLRVPDVLLNGNHKEIEAWRHAQSVSITRNRRPDLIK